MFKRKIIIILLGYVLGIIVELYFKKGIALIVLVSSFCICLIKYTKLSRKSILRRREFGNIKRFIKYLKLVLNLKIVCIFIISFLIGVIYTKYLNNKYDNLYVGLETCEFIGIIQSDAKEKEYSTQYKIKIQSINGNDKYKNTNLYLNVSNNLKKLQYGDLICFKGEYIEAESQKNYGGFNYKEYLKTLKIYGTVKCNNEDIELCDKNKADFISLKMNNLANKIKENTYKLFEKEEANLLIGILIGDTSKIDEELENDFRNSSLLHILAVSGTHINYIIFSLVYLNNKLKISKKIGRIITIIVLILFMFLVGFSASVVRAVIMGIIIMLSKLFYRKLDITNSISFSALILLIINPFNIINAGFLLSYGGTIGIVSLSSNIKRIFIKENQKEALITVKKRYLDNLIKSIKEILIITVSAQIVIMPILAHMFNTISLTFFISNLIASPLMGVITILGFITIFISFVSITISKVLALLLNIPLKFLIFLADFFGSMKISKIYIITIPMFIFIIYYAIVYIFNYYIYLKHKKLGKREMRVLFWYESIKYILKKNCTKILIVCTIIFITYNVFLNLTRKFNINFIDVGQR